ncbi:MAG: membrane dipeptidase, partial [Candidatus Hydrogenedentes bacterium]|nr:membrane dipeptidase [Candidatus Hydrogenedentota bacterium]
LTREYLDFADKMVEETRRLRGDVIEIARTFADMRRITGAGKICMLHAIEGAHHLNGNIDMVDELAARGVCHMIVPHLYPNESGGCVNVFSKYRIPAKCGCFNTKYQDASGLTACGRELIEKLLDVGILVDATHGTLEYRKQVLDIVRSNSKKRPLVMSHACVTGDDSSEFGPTSGEIKDIADTGGAIGMMMFTHREASQQRTLGIDYVLNGIDHLVRYGGEDVVAIGSDFDGTTDVAKDMRSPRDYRPLREAMLRKYTEDQVAKFTCGNAERALKNGWGK